MTSSNRPPHRTLADYIAWCQADERQATPASAPQSEAAQRGAPKNASDEAPTPVVPDTGAGDRVFESLARKLAGPLHRSLAYWRLRTTDVTGFLPEVETVSQALVSEWRSTGALRPLAPCTDPVVPEVADWRLDWAFHVQPPAAVASSLDMETLYIRRALRPVFVAGINAGGSPEGFLRCASQAARELLEAFLAASDPYGFLLQAPFDAAPASSAGSSHG